MTFEQYTNKQGYVIENGVITRKDDNKPFVDAPIKENLIDNYNYHRAPKATYQATETGNSSLLVIGLVVGLFIILGKGK